MTVSGATLVLLMVITVMVTNFSAVAVHCDVAHPIRVVTFYRGRSRAKKAGVYRNITMDTIF
jgi:hypothetical protein